MVEPFTVAAVLAFDAALGWPAWLHNRIGHPVGIFARIIASCERHGNRPSVHPVGRRLFGLLTVAILLVVGGGTGWLIDRAIWMMAGPAGWPLVALAAWPAMAQRSLYVHVRPVFEALKANDLPTARQAVSMIVGRDTDRLDRAGVARAAIETLAESFCDGVVAPLFWLLVGGLPGIWAYKAINTADSLIGHTEPALHAFGWAAARTDDLVNLVPARLSAIFLCLSGGGGWRILWRDHRHHASPNAGWPEAAVAGALGVRLAGPVWYDGRLSDALWIGDGPSADQATVGRALNIYLRACMLMGIFAMGATWLS